MAIAVKKFVPVVQIGFEIQAFKEKFSRNSIQSAIYYNSIGGEKLSSRALSRDAKERSENSEKFNSR